MELTKIELTKEELEIISASLKDYRNNYNKNAKSHAQRLVGRKQREWSLKAAKFLEELDEISDKFKN